MNNLSKLVEFLIDPSFGAPEAFLAGIDRIGKQGASFLDGFGVTAFCQIHAFGFEKALKVLEQFVFF